MRPAVFLDRDGVLVEDLGLVARAEDLRILPDVPHALGRLRQAGLVLVVITNQPVIARGLASETDIRTVHQQLEEGLIAAGAPKLDAWYFCPHHPKAEVAAYRVICHCRKPRPGMLRQAARDLGLDLAASYMVGDRITDIAAGASAGCRTVQVETGKHTATPITLVEPLDPNLAPDHVCPGLAAAADWILRQR
jgi:D-glycero-D-manno-heptose 1,7-bisphosphate phosphatase